MKKRLLLLFLAVGIFIIWLFFSNPISILNNLLIANPIFVVLAVSLTLISLLLKSLRWKMLLKDINIKIPFSLAFSSFNAGLFISLLTPGRIGEPVRGLILKRKIGSSFSKALPLIVVERMVDLLTILAFSALLLFSISSLSPKISFFLDFSAIISLIVLVIIIIALLKENFGKILFKIILKLPKIKKLKAKSNRLLENFYSSSKKIKLKTLLFITILTVLVWALEGVILYLALRSIGLDIAILICIEIVALGQVIGLVSSLPGGIGSVEAVMTLLLIPYLLTVPIATTAVLIYRFTSFWIAMLIGGTILIKIFSLDYLKKMIK